MAAQMISLDKIDHKILQVLLADGRASYSKIAKETNLTDVAIKKRVESLKRKGVIESISANLNFKVLGFENPVFIQIRTDLAKSIFLPAFFLKRLLGSKKKVRKGVFFRKTLKESLITRFFSRVQTCSNKQLFLGFQ